MATLRDRVPDQDVAVQAVHRPPVGCDGGGYPVVVVGRPQLVRIPVLERPADADDEDGRDLLQDERLALLAGQVGIAPEEILGMEEGDLLRQIGIAARAELREQLLDVYLGSSQDAPDGPNGVL